MKNKRSVLLEGIRDGIPIALGYFAVSFSLGIAMRNAGMTSVEGFFFSMFNLASAGEYAGLQVILSNGSYIAMALATLVATALSQVMVSPMKSLVLPSTAKGMSIHGMSMGHCLFQFPHGHLAQALASLPAMVCLPALSMHFQLHFMACSLPSLCHHPAKTRLLPSLSSFPLY